MVSNEQSKGPNQLKRIVPIASSMSYISRVPTFQTKSVVIPEETIDVRAIDISSIKGRFAWEKITLGDTYMPVIFRGTTKYFCVKLLRTLLPEYPEDVIRRSAHYHYGKSIDLYAATPSEIDLLNRINIHHSQLIYSRESLTAADELVRVSDFIPFYEHLRLFVKPTHISRTLPSNTSRPIGSQVQQNMQRSPDFIINASNGIRENSTMRLPMPTIPIQSYSPSIARCIATSPPALRPSRPLKNDVQSWAPPRSSSQCLPIQKSQESNRSFIEPTASTSSNGFGNPTNTKNLTKSHSASIAPSTLKPTTPTVPVNSSSSNSNLPSSTTTNNEKPSANLSEKQSVPPTKQVSVCKSSRLNSGWLQINKLYTPYVSSSTINRHLYKIPVSLLTFYELLKIPSTENNTNESKDLTCPFEQTLVTPQEIELINELCLKQNIKPFSVDTKLIDLLTFYKYSSTSVLFIKELPLDEPKGSICRDWPSIVKINGGICRLRNTTTLHEQTVPFIGNNLLKTFMLSSQSLASASLTTPTTSEIEFLQLILFFSNMSINLRNVKLIDIESVQKEYNVDLILLFNDKFPLNVLNYQNQGKRSSTPQELVVKSDSSAAAHTFAQSTPPPSPISSPSNNVPINPTAQLPLTSSSSNSSNRFQKQITFREHTITAYICSGLGSNSQRECVSIRELCNIFYPNSSIIDKLETKLLRILRSKNINRFRPQNQQSMGFTRLVDIKDVGQHWKYIEEEMRSSPDNDEEKLILRDRTSSLSDKDLKASTLSDVDVNSKIIEQDTSIDVNKNEKQSLERKSEEENRVDSEPIQKRLRLSREDDNEQSKMDKTSNNQCNSSEDDNNNNNNNNNNDKKAQLKSGRISTPSVKLNHQQTNKILRTKTKAQCTLNKSSIFSGNQSIGTIKKKIKLNRKRPTSRIQSRTRAIASWVKKYSIEECCICLDLYEPMDEIRKD